MTKLLSKTIILPVAMALLGSCSGNQISPLALKKHVEDAGNGFVQTVDSGPYHIKCMYTPPAYLAVQSFKSNRIDAGEYRARMAEFDKTDMYRLEITASDPDDIASLSEYFNFYMQENLSKVCENETLPCTAYLSEPFNAIDRKQRIAFGFEKGACTGTESIRIQNSPLGESIRFSFDKKNLTTPSVALN